MHRKKDWKGFQQNVQRGCVCTVKCQCVFYFSRVLNCLNTSVIDYHDWLRLTETLPLDRDSHCPYKAVDPDVERPEQNQVSIKTKEGTMLVSNEKCLVPHHLRYSKF